MIQIATIDHIALNTRDVAAAMSFYGDVLGLPLERRDAFLRGEVGFVSVRLGAQLVDLMPASGEVPSGGAFHHLCLVLAPGENIEAAARHLESAGYPVQGPPTIRWGARGNGLSFYLADPDGNTIEIKAY